MAAREVVVMVLDDAVDAELTPWGWRGHVAFRGRWDEAPVAIARDTSRRLGRELHVHAVVNYRGADWVVLRWATEYACIRPSTELDRDMVSQTRLRTAPARRPRKAAGR